MSSCLQSLPPETVTHIVRYVDKSSGLLDLALCCRSLYTLILPHLYSHVKLLYHDTQTSFPYLKPFVLHVSKNPQLASHVRDFTMDGCFPTNDTVRTFRTAGHAQGVEENWRAALGKGRVEDAFIALLLPLLPSLECLDLKVPGAKVDFHERMITRVVKRELPFNAKPAFSSLRVVVIDYDDSINGTSSDLMSNYIRLPSLREFYGRKIGSYRD